MPFALFIRKRPSRGAGQLISCNYPRPFCALRTKWAFPRLLPRLRNSEIHLRMDRSDLQQLSKEQLIDLVLRLQRPEKTSRTSSKPPSTDKKEKRENSRPGGAKPGMSRTIAGWPIIPTNSAITADACGLCGGACTADADDGVDRRIRRDRNSPGQTSCHPPPAFACRCQHCGAEAKLRRRQSPPRRRSGRASMRWRFIYKGFQVLSYERLRLMFRDAFGLGVSEGALMNMFIRSHARFKIEAEKAKAVLRAARVVASDETGVRIEGTNAYHWVFHCKDAVVHQPDYSRAARVVEETMGGHRPTSGSRTAIRPSNRTASATRHAWRIWRATPPSRWSMDRTIFRCASSFGLDRPSTWPAPSPN